MNNENGNPSRKNLLGPNVKGTKSKSPLSVRGFVFVAYGDCSTRRGVSVKGSENPYKIYLKTRLRIDLSFRLSIFFC